MNELATLLIETIKGLFGEDKISMIFYFGILLVSVLLFKEFKNKISEEAKNKNEQLDIALKNMLDLKFELIIYKNSSKAQEDYDKLKNKLLNSFPYVSYKLSRELRNVHNNISDLKIDELATILDNEIDGLKSNQDSSVVMINSFNILDNISYIYRMRLHTIFMSTTMTFMALLFILIFGFLYFALSNVDSGLNQYFLIQILINLVIFFFYVLLVASLFQEEKIKKGLWSWLYIIVSIIVSITLISLYTKWMWLGVIHFVLFFGMVFLLKKIVK
ncbi:hypothetical protein [Lysinibacillus boronitolerans]|uniref:Uncharacterized protein n=1 Tax=Lysinibacillus boronitolerans JCM 21713 = 10a = NBRC 103108 TaxID=1294264 RepID=A0ABR4Y6C2_9BACI|nr:hypothetical protein [Lysinibacillus boronitolerans]KGR89363.1 hypothetical protein CD31_00710 [Lysinibacillus boronitolerans JCM 21713 = 10a = NBRC 103108]